MSRFRPAAQTTGPDGRAWEIYAYRARRTNAWTIEAVTFGGHHERHHWRTKTEFRGQVLAQVEGSIARGDFPVPRNAVYDNRSARYRRARG
ncbi:MAG TPA: hypothetical protein VM690_02665 [Gaiellaceae bacterium]|nr:hypothetical protein [Gaiellaceae bacterium]